MSRSGKLPIEIPSDVQVRIEDGVIFVKGPKGELSEKVVDFVNVKIEEKEVLVTKGSSDKRAGAMWGLMRSLINNMVTGVAKGFEKKLEVNGVGYRVSASGNQVNLIVGYSHPVDYDLPVGITAKVEGNVITIEGIDKQVVGEVSAQIRRVRKPEPYKGKGIKYVDEVIVKKVGKTADKAK